MSILATSPYSAGDINTIFQAVLQRPATVGAVMAFAGSTLPNEQIRIQIEGSTEAQTNVDPVIRLYQAAFGRLADTAGLSANVATYIKGYDSVGLATSFLAGPEAAAIFGTANPSVTAGFVQTIYQNALNRTGSASELSYWVNSGKSAGQVLSEIANSQESINKSGVPTLTFLDAQATAALNGSSIGVTGSLFNQTATNYTFQNNQSGAADNVVGSVNSDTFTADGAFVNTIDTIDGGGGIDTLTINGAPQGTPGTIKGIEVINIVGSGNSNLDFSKASGLQLLTLRNDGTGTGTLSVKAGVLVGLDNATGGHNEVVTFTDTATYGSLAVANGTVAGTVSLNNSAITTLNVISTGSTGVTAKNVIAALNSTGVETTLDITGDRGLVINGTDASLTTIDASGNSAGVSVTAATANAHLTFVGGAGNDTLTLGTGSLSSTQSLDGGAGIDTLVVAEGSINTADQGTALSAVKNFEVLGFSASAGLVVDLSRTGSFSTFDVLAANLLTNAATGSSGTNDTVGTAGQAAAAFTNEVNGQTFVIDGNLTGQAGAAGGAGSNSSTGGAGGAALSLKPAFDNGSNVVNITLDGVTLQGGAGGDAGTSAGTKVAGVGGAAIDASAFETVNIVSNFVAGSTTGGNVLIDGAGGHGLVIGANATVNVSGAANINLDSIYSGNGVTPNNNVTLNAANLSGNLTVTTGTGNDVIIGGSGSNSITLTGGLDVVNLGASVAKSDVISLATSNLPAGVSPATIVSITGFTNSATTGDTLHFSTINFATTTANGAYTNGNSISITAAVNSQGLVTFSNVTGNAGFSDYVAAAAAAGGANKVVAFVYSGDTYVLNNDSTAAYTAGTDQIVKLVGLTGVAGLSNNTADATHIQIG